MAPVQVNKPRLRTFSIPVSALGTATFLSTFAYVTHGTPGSLYSGLVDIPFGGAARFYLQWFLYIAFIVIHTYEAWSAFKLATNHRASTLHLLLYTVTTFVLGPPILWEMERLIQVARVELVKGQKTK